MIDYLKKYISRRRNKRALILGLALLLMLGLGYLVDFDLVRLVRGLPSMLNLFQRMLRPNFAYLEEVGQKLIETIEIAAIASVIGLVLALPISLLVARNIAPSRGLWSFLNFVFAVLRTIPSLVWAAILVSIFSIGKFPGIVALSIVSFLAALKMYKDYIESLNENILNSSRSVGASNLQVLRHCVLPSIVEQSLAIFFMVLEINIRGAAVLGFVGAGGIGQIMWRDLNHLRYDKLSTLILSLFLTIFIIDFLSLRLRRLSRNWSRNYKSLEGFKRAKSLRNILTLLIVGLILLVAKRALTINGARMMLGLDQGLNIIRRMARPDFSYMDKLLAGLLESLSIAIFATVLGGLNALFLTYFSAYNLGWAPWRLGFFKLLINILRTFPSIVIAIIFFRGVGPGPLAGVMALSIYTSGVLTKLYSEIVEGLPENLLDSVRVTGADNFAIYRRAVLPASRSNFISLLLYRLESNMRNSTVLGIIGAGGVGSSLTLNINWRNWERVGLLIMGISIMVLIIDMISAKIRKIYN